MFLKVLATTQFSLRMDGYDIQNDSCIRQKAVEDTISDKCRTKIFNFRRGSREKLVKKVPNIFRHDS